MDPPLPPSSGAIRTPPPPSRRRNNNNAQTGSPRTSLSWSQSVEMTYESKESQEVRSPRRGFFPSVFSSYLFETLILIACNMHFIFLLIFPFIASNNNHNDSLHKRNLKY